MPVTKDNSIYEKTSFLSKSNSAFIESLYLKYINSDSELPQGWKEFFDGLGDEKKYILNGNFIIFCIGRFCFPTRSYTSFLHENINKHIKPYNSL